jgi:hypothetical protein
VIKKKQLETRGDTLRNQVLEPREDLAQDFDAVNDGGEALVG